jgi:hypothetical protein
MQASDGERLIKLMALNSGAINKAHGAKLGRDYKAHGAELGRDQI